MAKFKCLISGNVIEFTNQVDIDSMQGHEGYERLVETTEAVKAPATKKAAKQVVAPVEEQVAE